MQLKLSGDFIAQSSHVGWGFLLTLSPALIFHISVWWMAIGLSVITGAKEYWDSHGLESKQLAGNSWEDWAFWNVGIGWAVLVIYISAWTVRFV